MFFNQSDSNEWTIAPPIKIGTLQLQLMSLRDAMVFILQQECILAKAIPPTLWACKAIQCQNIYQDQECTKVPVLSITGCMCFITQLCE